MFKGIGVALVTPFNEDLSIDFVGLKKLLDHTSTGVDYFVVQGTTGESATTTQEEKVQVLEFVRENCANIPIVFGIGGNNTEGLIKVIKDTDFTGVSGVLSVSPYYNKPSQEGIYQHYMKLADTSPVPLILYNVPGRTSSNVMAETTLRLAEHQNIVAIKEASGDLDQCQEIFRHMPSGFQLISGDDMLTVPMLSIGGSGVISVLANAYPSIFERVWHYFEEKHLQEAAQEMQKLEELNPLMYAEGNPVGVKAVLSKLNICQDFVRLPLVNASTELQNNISQAMAGIKA